jgi:hypothetical protein
MMMKHFHLLSAAILLLFQGVIAYSNESRSIIIMNESSRRIEIHWVDPVTGDMVLQSEPDILDGASLELDSFVGHTFEVRELPAKKTRVCAGDDQTCRVNHFTVSGNSDQGKRGSTTLVSMVNCIESFLTNHPTLITNNIFSHHNKEWYRGRSY